MVDQTQRVVAESDDTESAYTEAPGGAARRQAASGGQAGGRRTLVLVALLVVLGAVAVASARSWENLAAARARSTELRHEIDEAELRLKVLEKRIRGLQEDPVVIERVAREELGYVRSDEILVVLPPDAEP